MLSYSPGNFYYFVKPFLDLHVTIGHIYAYHHVAGTWLMHPQAPTYDRHYGV